MHYGEIKNCDIANGEGVRVTLFVSGCTNHCEHCFQPQTWDFDYGQPFTSETEQQLLDLSEFFKVFGDSTRIKILYVLSQSEMCVCDIATLLQMGQSAISHQLRVLKQMRLVSFRRDGKTVFYKLADAHIQAILAQGMEHISE